MDSSFREHLEALAERLHLHVGHGEEPARELGDKLRSLLEDDEEHDYAEWLTEQAVEFETEHPDLAMLVRRTLDALSAGGI